MKSYTVHENRAPGDVDARTVLVREGFNGVAFVCPLLWAAYQRLWLGIAVYAGLALLSVGVVALAGADAEAMTKAAALLLFGPLFLTTLGDPGIGFFGLAIAALIAWEANDLRRYGLARRGYRVVDVVAGKTLTEAERAYFDARGLPPDAGPSGGGDVAPNEPILGLFSRWPRRT